MRKKFSQPDQYFIIRYTLKWTLYCIPLSAVVGSMIALFLWMLDEATHTRWSHPWLLYLLPLAGVGIVATYRVKGKNSDAGNNLVMDEIHKPGGGIPFRMAPLVLASTVLTHLFGGSAGREGTAVQIGGSISNLFGKIFKLSQDDLRVMLKAGVAAGFGAVFGTPVAGAIFALEVPTMGRVKYDALLPCIIAAVMADMVCSSYGIHHTHYSILYREANTASMLFHFNYQILLMAAVAGMAFGLASFIFSELIVITKNTFNKSIKNPYLIPLAGGVIIILLTWTVGTTDYLGLGVNSTNGNGVSIVNAFKPGGVDSYSWILKIIFTVITLSSGFKGGEVTPLFFIGACLGNTFASVSGMPVDLFAGLGFVAVFAGATNTPLACTIMGIELFGGEHILYFATACFVAYYFSGHTGIYSSQRIGVTKAMIPGQNILRETLKSIREKK